MIKVLTYVLCQDKLRNVILPIQDSLDLNSWSEGFRVGDEVVVQFVSEQSVYGFQISSIVGDLNWSGMSWGTEILCLDSLESI